MPIAGAAVLGGFAVGYLGYHLREAADGPMLDLASQGSPVHPDARLPWT